MPEYPHAASLMSKGMTQDQMWRMVLEGPMPQLGIRSVVVEHGSGSNSPEPQPQPLVGDDFTERMFPPAKHDEQPTISCALPGAIGKDTNVLPENVQLPSFEYEQQLEFLRYLVQQGVVNEGFAEGQVPTQYQSKQED